MKLISLISLCLLFMGGCASPRSDVHDIRQDEIAAAITPTAAAKAKVKADEHALAIDERLSARGSLLRSAVIAIAVVALCLVGASYFPMLAPFLKTLAGGAGIFAAAMFVLRSLVNVPEWLFLVVLGLVGVVALVRVLWHAKGMSGTLHEIVAATGEPKQLSGKAQQFIASMRAWRDHHVPKPLSPVQAAPSSGAPTP